MKPSLVFSLCTFAATSMIFAQPTHNAEWLGVWHGALDGQPGVVLTLADDAGMLGGTVVLNVVMKENGQARVAGTEPHVLLNPRVDGGTLVFKFKRRDGELAEFTVRLTATDQATIHCTNCGDDAPTADIARAK